jgi:hypothetical protein
MSVNANTVGAWVTSKIAPLLLVMVVTVASYPARAAVTSDQDFAARCAALGVVLCKGFDSASDIAANIQPAGDGTIQGSLDTANKTSGAGSLRFTLRAGVRDANIGGAYSTPMGHTFNVGDTIYVQWRQRVTPEFLSNNTNYWRSSVKSALIHGPSSTCQGAEYATVLYGDGNKPEMYTNCGDGFDTFASDNTLCNGKCGGSDLLVEQGSSLTPSPNGDGYNCHYNNQFAGKGDGTGCFFMPANTWVTFYEKIQIGAFGGSTSAVDAWVSVNGGPYKQFQRAAGITFNNNGDNFFSMIRLETYMTELERTGQAAPVTTYIWYDELIVSTQPIAIPGSNGVVQLSAPQNLRVTN